MKKVLIAGVACAVFVFAGSSVEFSSAQQTLEIPVDVKLDKPILVSSAQQTLEIPVDVKLDKPILILTSDPDSNLDHYVSIQRAVTFLRNVEPGETVQIETFVRCEKKVQTFHEPARVCEFDSSKFVFMDREEAMLKLASY